MLSLDDYFLIPPDWTEALRYTRTWRTSIQRVIRGYEKRTILFTWPRRTLNFYIRTLNAAEFALLKRKLYKNVDKLWGVPFWQDETTLSAQAAAEQKTLSVGDTRYRNFEVGAPCIIYTDEDTYEIGEIAAKTQTSITLTENLATTWPAGTSVYPLLQGRILTTQEIKLTTNTVSVLPVTIVEDFDADITRTIGTATSFPSYRSRAVFDTEPEWRETMTMRVNKQSSFMTILGKSYAFTTQKASDLRYAGSWSFDTKAEIQDMIDFFDSRCGRAYDFFFPSWQRDIEVTEAFSDSDTVFTVSDIDYDAYWNDGANYVCFLFPDDTAVYRRILRFDSATEMVLDAAIGVACTEDELQALLVSFFNVCRFDMDELEITYLTDSIAEARTLSVATLLQTTTTSTTSTTTTTAEPIINTYIEDIEVYFPTTTTSTTTSTTTTTAS